MGKVSSSDALDSRVQLASIQIPQPLLASCTNLGSFTTLLVGFFLAVTLEED